MTEPATRASLLMRIRDRDDQDAWVQFEQLYRPVVYSVARQRGLQDADAEDVAQSVLLAVADAVERFDPTDRRASFRTWLKTIAHRAAINLLTRRVRDRGVGGTDMVELLHELPAADAFTQSLTLDYRRRIFRVAAESLKSEFAPATWRAFWDSVVQQKPVDVVAKELGRSRGSVYTSRSRVMARLREVVAYLDVESTTSLSEPSP
ncbi:MAG: sigma-70 family RNA polymerase sigma factor [Planctomycetota bacterium]